MLRVFLAERFISRTTDRLKPGAQVAFTASEALTLETYQFKGRVIRTGECTEADLETFERQKKASSTRSVST
ncbi:MAG: hypothetical protein IIA75_06530 [Proteobacteria bacterium]|nr:hypothetical protein [Pseudomonadota bacterium]